MTQKFLFAAFMLFWSLMATANCTDEFQKSPLKQSDLLEVLKCIEQLKMRSPDVPVGTVVASMLSPSDFSSEVGDPVSFNAKSSRWTLADGRSIEGSRYQVAAVSKKIPDLRGMFLRGLNVGRSDGLQDPDAARDVGNVQLDELKSHTHEIPFNYHGLKNGNGNGNLESNAKPISVTPTGGAETRPRNVAIYYYIKIN